MWSVTRTILVVIQQTMGAGVEHQANLAIKTPQAEQKVRDKTTYKMGRSFDALICAAVVKSEIIDSHTATIKSLIDTVTELTATNKKLVDQLSGALVTCVKPPPGLTNPPPPSPAATNSGHILNSVGIAYHAKLEPMASGTSIINKTVKLVVNQTRTCQPIDWNCQRMLNRKR